MTDRVHLAYREPNGWTCPSKCLPSDDVDRYRRGLNSLSGPDAAARRTWVVEPCDFAEAAGTRRHLDYALPGTLGRRYMRCGKQDCRCKADPPALHGPYLHWTRTVAGKTVTRTLTEEQARRYQPWFDNARQLRELITALEARSLRAFLDAEG